MNKRVLVLGGGLVGGPIADDLADSGFSVTLIDPNRDALKKRSNKVNMFAVGFQEWAFKGYDYIVNALPGSIGFAALKKAIKSGTDVVDISFFPEDPLLLRNLASDCGVTVLVDCGIAPGMSNLLVGDAYSRFDKVDSAQIYVGGLPLERTWPYQYKAPFSPFDVVAEYTRPAMYRKDGEIKRGDPLTMREFIEVPGIGTLEAFLTDGLRTLTRIHNIPNMVEKTLRYPGHADRMLELKAIGFFDGEHIESTSRLLAKNWRMNDNRDFTYMLIKMRVRDAFGKKQALSYSVLDFGNEKLHSMARTTGYTAIAALKMLEAGLYTNKDVSPLEEVGCERACVDFMLANLATERNIIFNTVLTDESSTN